jgi:hypothetical protein
MQYGCRGKGKCFYIGGNLNPVLRVLITHINHYITLHPFQSKNGGNTILVQVIAVATCGNRRYISMHF